MKKATVADRTPRMEELEKKRALVRDLLGGTPAMVAAGKKWLPQHPGESDGNYRVRLESNTLTNFTEQSVHKSANRIMAKPVTLTDLPEALAPMLANIDLQGRDINAFAMDVLKQAFGDGISYILVDKPDASEVKTVADEKAQGIRPYAIHILPCCLLEVMSEIINGVQTLTRVRIMECTSAPDGEWGYSDRVQIRELLRVADKNGMQRVDYRIWEEQDTAAGPVWAVVREGITAMKRIALIPVYTNRVGFMEGLPPFQSTAELNLDHWRVKSEQKNALTMNCFEMLAATGVDDGWAPKVGPAQVQSATAADAKFYYLSPTGKGVELAADYLKDIEAQIDDAKANLRVENGGKVSATAAAIDSEEGSAGLKAVAGAASKSFHEVIICMAEMAGIELPTKFAVHVNDDLGQRKGTDAGLQELGKIRALGDLSRQELFEELRWRGEIRPTFDTKVNDDALGMEGPPEPQGANAEM